MAQRLVLLEPHGPLVLENYEPSPSGNHQVQVKNEATSLNHLDWKRIEKNLFIPSFPHVFGMDIAGQVINAGTSQCLKVGDRILAPGRVGYSEGCSFQTHVLVDENHCAKIGPQISFVEASTLPFSLSTAACGLYLGLGLDIAVERSVPVLIWGANGAVGKLAIQLAKLSGYSVIAVTSSKATTDAARARGADTVFDNGDPDVVSKIRAEAPQLSYAFDTVVSSETVQKATQCCQRPAKIATAIKFLGEPSENVEIIPVFSGEIMGKTLTGQESAKGQELGRWLWKNLPIWLEESKVSPLENEEIGGLDAIVGGLKSLKNGTAKVKLVARIGSAAS